MNWDDYLTLATRLAAGTTEAEWRSAISRAYYAAFHSARRLLGELGFAVPPDASGHPYLSYRLSNCGDPGVELAGRQLNTLRAERNHADYGDVPTVIQAAARAAVHVAQQITQTLDAANHEPVRTRITNAIVTYELTVLGIPTTWQP